MHCVDERGLLIFFLQSSQHSDCKKRQVRMPNLVVPKETLCKETDLAGCMVGFPLQCARWDGGYFFLPNPHAASTTFGSLTDFFTIICDGTTNLAQVSAMHAPYLFTRFHMKHDFLDLGCLLGSLVHHLCNCRGPELVR